MNAAPAYGMEQGDGKAAQLQAQFNRQFQHYLDKSVPHIKERWGAFAVVVLIYITRFSFLRLLHRTYGLGIYNLNLVIGFLSPQVDPATGDPPFHEGQRGVQALRQEAPGVQVLVPIHQELRHQRSSCVRPNLDVPVFWPILLMYWFMLFFMTMKQQIGT